MPANVEVTRLARLYRASPVSRRRTKVDRNVGRLTPGKVNNMAIDIEWANGQLPTGVTRQDVCVWVQDSDGPWCTSCGKVWEFNDGGPAENGAHFCHHCGGVLLAEPFHDDETPNKEVTGSKQA